MRMREDILLEKQEAMKEILSVTMKQPECIDADDTEGLLNCITMRQNYIDLVNALDGELADAPSDGSGHEPRIASDIRDLIARIGEQDKKNEERATLKLEEYRGKMLQANENKRGITGYADHLGGGGRSSYDVRK